MTKKRTTVDIPQEDGSNKRAYIVSESDTYYLVTYDKDRKVGIFKVGKDE